MRRRVLQPEIGQADDGRAEHDESGRHEAPPPQVAVGAAIQERQQQKAADDEPGITMVATGSSGPGKYFSS